MLAPSRALTDCIILYDVTAWFKGVAAAMKTAYHAAFYNSSSGSYGDVGRCAQTANILPLVLGVVPAKLMDGVVSALVDSITQAGECSSSSSSSKSNGIKQGSRDRTISNNRSESGWGGAGSAGVTGAGSGSSTSTSTSATPLEPTIKSGQVGTRHVLQALVAAGHERLARKTARRSTHECVL